ncbi:efflux RND transporter periplasmic adaptor subunit [Herbaspirillum huttiense]|jgi:membrane fusion protein (multidrug efflux system)|uniref:HlyD family efflux transporter periplasmic adaptor subunit n=3 Tax=Herbaspirillum huttiense TaxID=863372 RepID=A0AAJ2HCX6_9BURK|nr:MULTISPECIES: HlyD family efflux transporter periplasmic adaptor subunit [Herbaspirillum]MBN9355441.1 HlyD family efflux transporter periplasmic adaptor subunit [Herbaspirillum huttiense]MCO4856128.1 HlyD family efflux transporter periplasmic adaptor subunit [Herbaspirillum sp. WGmk3]MDR9836505.1 HlyD family efflux transporter periplasmic adaptor subunit [Herbaspirillum huttiense]MDR9847396.1 HlyD family efflux transporter periplasmic adaptor subunit [Herbaspirillum huttiense SE1]MDT0354870
MSDSTTQQNPQANSNGNGNGNGNGKRKRQLILLTLVLLVIAIACFLYWFLHARFFEETDDAYVGGNVVQISAQVGGTVVAVKADDTQVVKAGQPLVALDAADTKLALEQAQAALAQAVRQTRQLFLNNDTLAANVAAADSNLARAREDLQRRQAGLSSGAVSQEDVSHARDAVKSAVAALDQARAAAAANRALTDHTSVTEHPNVLQAATAVRNAYLNYARVNIVAPVSGFVSKRSVQVGQRIAAGNPLMAIVPLEQIWIDANFKESQLQHIRLGQPVEVIADVYGSSVKYKGTVIGFSAGTGGAFSLLPAQNATGNWIKVVQRVPVRIALDPEQVRAHPLRIGLSTTATVDIHGDGRALEAVPTNYQTNVYDDLGKQADAIVERIISDNASGLPQARKSKAAAAPVAVPHT